MLFDRSKIKAVPAVLDAHYDLAADLLRLMVKGDSAAGRQRPVVLLVINDQDQRR
ncbi:MAG: hypothetical protein HND59_10630 [Pseudomonadota bacterium]|nr:MAG: hypothetical protein HND59_10630 [Pseudomonadota bacterium]